MERSSMLPIDTVAPATGSFVTASMTTPLTAAVPIGSDPVGRPSCWARTRATNRIDLDIGGSLRC
jgi:hypothetical protein